jgi:hypothetical protein
MNVSTNQRQVWEKTAQPEKQEVVEQVIVSEPLEGPRTALAIKQVVMNPLLADVALSEEQQAQIDDQYSLKSAFAGVAGHDDAALIAKRRAIFHLKRDFSSKDATTIRLADKTFLRNVATVDDVVSALSAERERQGAKAARRKGKAKG